MRRHNPQQSIGNAKPREVHEDGSIQEQTSEIPDGALGSDDVCCTGEQWDQHEESFEQDEDDVQFDGDEEVQRLIESESEAFGSCLTSELDIDPSTAGGQRCPATRRPLPKGSTAVSARETDVSGVVLLTRL